MELDTVPIPTEHLDQISVQASTAEDTSKLSGSNLQNGSAAGQPARPKAVTRRRR